MFAKLTGWLMAAAALALVGCGGGGADAGDSPFNPGNGETTTLSISLVLSSATVTSAVPVTVTAKVIDGTNAAVSGAKVDFSVTGLLGNLSATSALTDSSGLAVVTLTPASTTASGADTVNASVTLNAVVSSASAGFQLTATDAEFTSVLAAAGNGDAAGSAVAAYGQTTINVVMTGVSEASPATVALSSSCVDSSKAAISPTNVTTTTGVFSVVYTDSGCGALFGSDTVTATLAGSSTLKQGTVFLSVPAANNMAFVSATPSTIYLRGSGLAESSTVLFQVNDTAGSPLPGQTVTLALTTYTGGLAVDGSSSSVVKTTDAKGQVSAIVNSGTVPTPVRVSATLNSGVSTVSNVLAVGVGLPTQLAFSLSQTAANLDCYTRDGVPNVYTVYAADRSGNPVPAGTALTFWAEGGQVVTSRQTVLDSTGIASATSSFVCQAPVPEDGRVTITAYAIGEESFIDLNGDNVYTQGEPFQDLGDVVKDSLFDNSYDSVNDEFVSLNAGSSSACLTSFATAYPKLALDKKTANRPGTCDGIWSRRAYVRKSTETVMSTSEAGLIWASTSGLGAASCHARTLRTTLLPDDPTQPTTFPTATFYEIHTDDLWYTNGEAKGSINFIVADANPVRFNPMAAGTVLTATNPTDKLSVSILGSPVVSTTEPTSAAISFEFDGVTSGEFTLNAASPSGLTTSYRIGINTGTRTNTCP